MMNKDQRLRNIFYLLLSIIVAAGIWYYVDESCFRRYGIFPSSIPERRP